MEHYLDNSATTKVSKAAAQKAFDIMCENYGNASSLHSLGLKAETELEGARKIISKALGCESSEIYFTSGGTEANNTAVFGAAQALKRRGNKIVTSSVEHSSVLESMKELENRGFDVIYLNPDENGIITADKISNAVDDKTILVSIMTANNETGALNDISKIRKIVTAKKSPALIHTDAVQAFGKINIKVKKTDVDLMTITAHKIHGPKGVGALYIKKGKRIVPLHFGGEQEKKIRPGTEALPLIGAFGVAVSELEIDKNYEKISELNAYARKKLSQIDGITFNSGENALPYIMNISVKGIRSETMLHFLAQNEIYVSSGSACAKGKPSHVLSAMGVSRDSADSALRISFSKYNTKDDIDVLAKYIEQGIQSLAKK
ncbi:MAG: cysteine desulfurase family protein [Oscillospiraceae bacterium]|nr:cysteine desulfurase family protein [Oscillospiraceae bacterium]